MPRWDQPRPVDLASWGNTLRLLRWGPTVRARGTISLSCRRPRLQLPHPWSHARAPRCRAACWCPCGAYNPAYVTAMCEQDTGMDWCFQTPPNLKVQLLSTQLGAHEHDAPGSQPVPLVWGLTSGGAAGGSLTSHAFPLRDPLRRAAHFSCGRARRLQQSGIIPLQRFQRDVRRPGA